MYPFFEEHACRFKRYSTTWEAMNLSMTTYKDFPRYIALLHRKLLEEVRAASVAAVWSIAGISSMDLQSCSHRSRAIILGLLLGLGLAPTQP